MQQSRPQDVPAPGASEKEVRLGDLVSRRKWLLLFGLAVGVGLGYLYFTQQPPVYKTAVRMLVTQDRPPLPTETTGSVENSRADLVATQCLVVTSEVVIRSAVENYGLASRPEFKSREYAIAQVARGLEAVPAVLEHTPTEVMELSYQGGSPEECRAVVDAVVKAYDAFLRGSDRAMSVEVQQLVGDAKNQLDRDLDALEKEYAAHRKEVPPLGQGDEKVNPHTVRLAKLDSERTDLMVKRSQLQAKIDAIRDALARGGSREALTLMINQLKEDEKGNVAHTEAVAAAEKLFPLQLEKELLLSEGLGPDHPKVQSIEKQIQLTRSHLDRLLNKDGSGGKPKDLLEVYLDSLQYEIEANKAEDAKLAAIFEKESEAARQLDAVLTKDAQLRREIDRKGRLLDAIVKRLDEMSLFNARGIRTQVIAEPGLGVRTPVRQVQYMAIGGVAGLVLLACVAYLFEVNDRTFRSPEDIRDEVGAAVIGHVPVITSKTATTPGLSPVLCTVHTPKSPTAEAFRLVRTALFFGARSGKLKVVQVTSPDQGDGKSTVCCNLAVTVAQSGRRTLLIDADMRRPTVHRIFGVGNEAGLSGVIAGAAEPGDAIRETAIPNLHVLTCGPRPHNPAELLASKAFEDFLGLVREQYDLVIIDSPPLLAVSDPGNVASRVDGVILTLRLGKRTRGKAVEAREILDRVGADVIGIVINGVDAKGEYGYRAAYRYSYAGQYAYRYGARYGQGYYHSDEHHDEEAGRKRSANGHSHGHEPARLRGDV